MHIVLMESLAIDGFSRGSVEKIQHLLSEAKRYKEEGNEKYQGKEIGRASCRERV